MMAFFGWANVNDVTRFAKRMGKLLEAASKMLALPGFGEIALRGIGNLLLGRP
jgi:hypothetical protein